ncbi:NIPSNAP family protein [Pseudonocardia nigra]|uniref:NIPSNAP family protein n=1 Tax=Pseudonocardia nigra TaxID=1921578 RepID=UPI001C5E2E53|nr:NIPSNAP family protein [Pseudonocardia nigra]
MIYEIREYTTVPGRMPALVTRFNDHTLGLFAKHAMEVVFLSLTELGANSTNELVYVLRFDSYAEMAEKWAAFQADPEWRDARGASEADGPIVASINRRVLSPAAFAAR